MSSHKVGLVGVWDVVAFDEVAWEKLQGQGRRADYEGFPWPLVHFPGAAIPSVPSVHGLCGQHQPKRGYAGQNQPPICPLP